MQALIDAARAYARSHANSDGLACTPVPGLRMMCVAKPAGDLHSVYRPLVCFVLQGKKRLVVGETECLVSEGRSIIVAADMPVIGRIVEAKPEAPYVAIAVELDMGLLRELVAQIGLKEPQRASGIETLFADDTEAAMLDCAARLMQLLDRPRAIPILQPAILRELHYWLLAGPHAAALRTLADPSSHAGRLAQAIEILRRDFRSRIPVERLADAAAMSLTAFHRHFKAMTSLTPGQYQKRLRLIEARRLMLEEGLSASSAAFEVGYESVSQFTREYGRLYKAPPKQDVLKIRRSSIRTGAEPEAVA